jgi:hypothetical protein
MPLFISQIPGNANQDQTDKFKAVCPDQFFPVPGCIKRTGGDNIADGNDIKCRASGVPFCQNTMKAPVCCPDKTPDDINDCKGVDDADEGPTCEESAETDTVVSNLPSHSGFITKDCDKKPRACRVCQYCCSHAFGSDKAKVKKCQDAVCDSFAIFVKCVMRLRELWLWLPCCVCGLWQRTYAGPPAD